MLTLYFVSFYNVKHRVHISLIRYDTRTQDAKMHAVRQCFEKTFRKLAEIHYFLQLFFFSTKWDGIAYIFISWT